MFPGSFRGRSSSPGSPLSLSGCSSYENSLVCRWNSSRLYGRYIDSCGDVMVTKELEEVIEAIGFKVPLSEPLKTAIRTISPEIRMLRAALVMFDTTPNVLLNVLEQTLSQWKKLYTEPKNIPPNQAGGVVKLVADNSNGPSEPKPLTLEELETLIPAATKEATTFEKAPELGLVQAGDAFLVRVKRVHKGVYDTPLVIANEFATYKDGKMGPLTKEDRRVETFAIRRAQEKGVKLVEGLVYFVKLVGIKPSKFERPFMQAVVINVGQDFPTVK